MADFWAVLTGFNWGDLWAFLKVFDFAGIWGMIQNYFAAFGALFGA